MRGYCLSIHAEYACRHAGACCTTAWEVPLEPVTIEALRRSSRTHAPGTSPDASRLEGTGSGIGITLPRHADGRCVFHEPAGQGLCSIHRDLGQDAMPSACRNFPRVALRDARGLFITLSHYCPTAARMLLTAADISIVPAPPSLSLGGTAEGLDATDVMPPLLRQGMLMDLEGYDAWEREGLAVLNERRYSARLALAIIRSATLDACAWRPGRETLAVRMSRAFARARLITARQDARPVPFDRPTKAFLAAHLFASWAAYQGWGLAAVVESLDEAMALLGTGHAEEDAFVERVRAADLRLRHMEAHDRPRPVPALRRG